jgi:hypothetical protein
MKKLLLLLLFPTLLVAQKKYTVSGVVSDAKNGEPFLSQGNTLTFYYFGDYL